MTLPKTPLKEWLPSLSSPQNVDQRGGSCRIPLSLSFSLRKCPPKSPPSSDPEDGEVWLQEARALPLQNALQILIKTLFGSSCGLACGQHTGRKSLEIHARCYSASYSTACGHLCARMVARMKFQTWCFLHISVLQYLLQSSNTYRASTRGSYSLGSQELLLLPPRRHYLV